MGSSKRLRFAEASVERFLTALAAREPAPSGDAAATFACAFAAALVETAASLTVPDGPLPVAAMGERAAAIGSTATRLADEDAAAYGRVIEALRAPRHDALTGALLAEAAALAAARLVEINLASAPGDSRVQRGRDLARRALAARERALAVPP